VVAGLDEAKNPAGKSSHLIQDRLGDADLGKNLANLSNQFATNANRYFRFQKRSQLFIRAHNEMLSVVARRSNDDARESNAPSQVEAIRPPSMKDLPFDFVGFSIFSLSRRPWTAYPLVQRLQILQE
jgi:hypothetical protein